MKRYLILTCGLLLTFSFAPLIMQAQTPGNYNSSDISVVNTLISVNGLSWTPAPLDGSSVPGDWLSATWSSDATNKRIIDLNLNGFELTGSVSFVGLTEIRDLFCRGTSLTSLDLSGLISLERLICWDTGFTSLDVSSLSALESLSCQNPNLTSLNVSGLSSLKILSLYHCSNFTTLNVSGCTALESLYFEGNFLKFNTLDVSGLTALKSLTFAGSGLTSLNVSGCTALEMIYLYDSLTTLDVSGLTALKSLSCGGNNLTSLEVSGCTALEILTCGGSSLTTLNTSGLIALETLECNNSHLTSLNVSGCTSLERLNCSNNHLTFLDLTGISPNNFNGGSQSLSLALTQSNPGEWSLTTPIDFLPTSFGNTAITFDGTTLKSTNDNVAVTTFAVQTIGSSYMLSGALSLIYITSPTIPPVITINTQPTANTTFTVGSISGSLSVAASVSQNEILNYQWFSNTTNSNLGGTLIPGATNSNFTIPTTLSTGIYYYYCIVSATGGAVSVPSYVATIIVTSSSQSVVPNLNGPTEMSLLRGYAATSTGSYTITGTSPVEVTKISGDNRITWNNATKKLDIAPGLPVGEYIVTLQASNNAGSCTLTFVLSVEARTFTINNPQIFSGGKVESYPVGFAIENQTVTLVITPNEGYELEYIYVHALNNPNILIPLSGGTGNTRMFTMPSQHIQVVAVFKSTSTANEDVQSGLRAYVQGGTLYISGLTKGNILNVYNINGHLLYHGVAVGEKVEIILPERGVYIIVSDDHRIKTTN